MKLPVDTNPSMKGEILDTIRLLITEEAAGEMEFPSTRRTLLLRECETNGRCLLIGRKAVLSCYQITLTNGSTRTGM
uniref:Uncharacterized protein n=1 Tax=Trichobilharzia regenti TaxID=157069 RepID=A0AA85J0R3_TRIRE